MRGEGASGRMAYYLIRAEIYPVEVVPPRGRIAEVQGIRCSLEGSQMDVVLSRELMELAIRGVICGLFAGERKSTRERDYILLQRHVIDYQELKGLDEVVLYAGDGEFKSLRRGEYDALAMAVFQETPDIFGSWEEYVERLVKAV